MPVTERTQGPILFSTGKQPLALFHLGLSFINIVRELLSCQMFCACYIPAVGSNHLQNTQNVFSVLENSDLKSHTLLYSGNGEHTFLGCYHRGINFSNVTRKGLPSSYFQCVCQSLKEHQAT